MTTVWIYVDRDHLKAFAKSDAADEWFKDNDPEGVAFEYEVKGYPSGSAGT
jgi:hypothetical protein